MSFDRRAGGHAFDFDAGVCARCGMTREHYQDHAQPPCPGTKIGERRGRERDATLIVPDDE
jgi:hypothetical protein